LINYYYS